MKISYERKRNSVPLTIQLCPHSCVILTTCWSKDTILFIAIVAEFLFHLFSLFSFFHTLRVPNNRLKRVTVIRSGAHFRAIRNLLWQWRVLLSLTQSHFTINSCQFSFPFSKEKMLLQLTVGVMTNAMAPTTYCCSASDTPAMLRCSSPFFPYLFHMRIFRILTFYCYNRRSDSASVSHGAAN